MVLVVVLLVHHPLRVDLPRLLAAPHPWVLVLGRLGPEPTRPVTVLSRRMVELVGVRPLAVEDVQHWRLVGLVFPD